MNKLLGQQAASMTAPGILGQAMYKQACKLIPGGVQLFSKRPENFAPGQWPPYYRHAKGCVVTDVDGRDYIDMSMMGIGSCLLGYADPDVTDAVVHRINAGPMCTLNCPEELELAELLLGLHPWADQVRYARSGGEAMAIAVRLARASTGRDRVAFCGYHGWHDWYLAANLATEGQRDSLGQHLLPGLSPLGVPRSLTDSIHPFGYNKIEDLRAIIRRYGNELAAIVMEPTRSVDPDPGFLEQVRALCDECGAVLVVDEITAGWRLHYGGGHMRYGLSPDIAVFAKAISNGHPMAAVIGRTDVMRCARESFVSSTYWTEGVGTVAAIATIRKMGRVDVPSHTDRIGRLFREGLAELAERTGVPLVLTGHPAITTLGFDHPQGQALLTLFTVRMLGFGILAGAAFYTCMAHQQNHIDKYMAAAEAVFTELAEAIRDGDIQRRIGGPVRQPGFGRLA